MKLFRILNLVVWALVLGLLGFFVYNHFEQGRVERELRAWIANLSEEERRARIVVDSVREGDGSGPATVDLRWVETRADGSPVDTPRSIRISGKEMYVDALQILFPTEAIREGDPMRSKALTVFRGIYGDDQKPRDAVPLEVPPSVARGVIAPAPGEPPVVPKFFQRDPAAARPEEERLWTRFWDLARNQELAKSLGVRTVQGTAVHKPAVEGMEYRITMTRMGQIVFDGPFEPDAFVKPPEK
jgi:hypothetical protein